MSPLLLLGTAFVAALYSSVGHGGASGYLAVMTLLSVAPGTMKGTALVLNLLVAGFACVQYVRARHWRGEVFWPFAVSSIPMAYLGGRMKLPAGTYEALLAAALLVAGLRLIVSSRFPDRTARKPGWALGLLLGAGIGLVSGLVGVGGGIFLSPLLLFAAWATAKEAGAASAAFIVVNSLSALTGFLQTGGVVDWRLTLWMLGAAAVGGAMGATWGAHQAPPVRLRQLLGAVLLIAAGKALFDP